MKKIRGLKTTANKESVHEKLLALVIDTYKEEAESGWERMEFKPRLMNFLIAIAKEDVKEKSGYIKAVARECWGEHIADIKCDLDKMDYRPDAYCFNLSSRTVKLIEVWNHHKTHLGRIYALYWLLEYIEIQLELITINSRKEIFRMNDYELFSASLSKGDK